jgi:hypothetical protein
LTPKDLNQNLNQHYTIAISHFSLPPHSRYYQTLSFEFAFTVIGTLAAVELSDNYLYGYISNNLYQRLLMISAIGLPLSFATSLFVQSKAFSLL